MSLISMVPKITLIAIALLSICQLSIVQSFHVSRNTFCSIKPFQKFQKDNNHRFLYEQTMTNSLKASTSDEIIESRLEPPRLFYFILWISLAAYAFGIAPGGTAEATLVDNELIKKLIFTPYDGTTNPIFVAIFNYLGILPAVYASLLLPGSKKQKVPTLPFVILSFALGFFATGPYLGLRSIENSVSDSEKGRGSFLFESKITGLLLLGFASFLTYYGISNSFGNPISAINEYIELFKNQRLVHVSTIDFTILSLAVCDQCLL